jgi:hypothetical protein
MPKKKDLNVRDKLNQVDMDIAKMERIQHELKAQKVELSSQAAEEDADALFGAVYEFAKELREGAVFACYEKVMDSWQQLSEHDPSALSKFGIRDSFGVKDSDEKYFLVQYFLQYLPRFDSIVDAVSVLKKGDRRPGNIFLNAPEVEPEEKEVAA